MFTQNPQVDLVMKEMAEERSAILRELEAANDVIDVKIRSLVTGKPAHYYDKHNHLGFTILDESLAHYQAARDALEVKRMEIDRKIYTYMQTINEAKDQASASHAPGKK